MTIKNTGKPAEAADTKPAEDSKGSKILLTLAKMDTYVLGDGRLFRGGYKYEFDKAESKELLKHVAPNGVGVFKVVAETDLEENEEVVKLRKAQVEITNPDEETHAATDADITITHNEAKAGPDSAVGGIEDTQENDLTDITVV